jgi:hypothetical protein
LDFIWNLFTVIYCDFFYKEVLIFQFYVYGIVLYRERLIMATTARATAAGAAALLYYTLNRKLQTQTTIDEDGDESGSNAPTDVQFCVTHRLIQAHATWFFRLLLFCGMKM